MDGTYVPIADRTAAQLRADAAELRQLARTATTEDVATALQRLAARYDAAAEARD